jgi:hypothetical protein
VKKVTATVLMTVFGLFIVFSGAAVSAQEFVGFSVEAQLPDNQVNEQDSFFNLRMEPGQEQDIETVIYNNENNEITVRISVYNASTNSNGLVVYEEQDEMDSSLEQPVTDIVTLEEDEVVIPAGESVTFTAALTMPEESFDGIKLGGLHFEKVPEETDAEEAVNINNQYAYVIGLQLSETDEEIDPELSLTSVEPKLVNHRTAVVVNLQNTRPVLMEEMRVDAQVYEEDSDEPIRTLEQENINMAPNSNMDVVIDWQNEPLAEGSYRVEVLASDGTDEWEWEEHFTSSGEASVLNESAVELETEDNNFIWYIAGVVLLIGIILILLVYIRKLKRK